MEKYYTELQLIKFIYGECDILEKLEIEYALENDENVSDTYANIKKRINHMPKVKFRPKSSTLSEIMDYSKSSLIAA